MHKILSIPISNTDSATSTSGRQVDDPIPSPRLLLVLELWLLVLLLGRLVLRLLLLLTLTLIRVLLLAPIVWETRWWDINLMEVRPVHHLFFEY